MTTEHPLRPSRVLLHPLWLAALVTLVLNDHVLKHSIYSGVITGKLSDFAGLLVAPILLATLLRVRTSRGFIGALAATGAVFACINVSHELAALFDATVSTIIPFVTVTDPTDLIALIMLPFGFVVFVPVMRAEARPRKQLEFGIAMVGGAACMATSPPNYCEDGDCAYYEPIETQVSMLNTSNEAHEVYVRQLRTDVQLDCEAVERAPASFLASDLFEAGARLMIESGQEVPLQIVARQQCSAARVEAAHLPDMVVFFTGSLPTKFVDPSQILETAGENTILIEANYENAAEVNTFGRRGNIQETSQIPEGAVYSWKSNQARRLHYEVSPLGSPIVAPSDACEMPGPGEGVFWHLPSTQGFAPRSLSEGQDGCHELIFEEGESWVICAPIAMVTPLLERQAVDQTAVPEVCNTESTGFTYCDGDVVQTCDGETGEWSAQPCSAGELCRPSADNASVECVMPSTLHVDEPYAYDQALDSIGLTVLGESSYTLVLSRGFAVVDDLVGAVQTPYKSRCSAQPDICGLPALPAAVEIGEDLLEPGQSLERTTESESIEIHLMRAAMLPVLDGSCETFGVSIPGIHTPYIEMAISRRVP